MDLGAFRLGRHTSCWIAGDEAPDGRHPPDLSGSRQAVLPESAASGIALILRVNSRLATRTGNECLSPRVPHFADKRVDYVPLHSWPLDRHPGGVWRGLDDANAGVDLSRCSAGHLDLDVSSPRSGRGSDAIVGRESCFWCLCSQDSIWPCIWRAGRRDRSYGLDGVLCYGRFSGCRVERRKCLNSASLLAAWEMASLLFAVV